jgi:hypothetical protein
MSHWHRACQGLITNLLQAGSVFCKSFHPCVLTSLFVRKLVGWNDLYAFIVTLG